MGAHRAGRKVWAPGRWRWLNRTLEAVFVLSLIAAAAFAGWVSHEPPPPRHTLNPPVQIHYPAPIAEAPPVITPPPGDPRRKD